jgi:hypothetical protein
MNLWRSVAAIPAAMLGALLIAPSCAHAQSVQIDSTLIGDRALGSVQGRVAVNVTAGDGNLQVNSAALTAGFAARAASIVNQQVDVRGLKPPVVATALIGERAFAGSSGLISVNQASGVGNLQVNSLAIAVGVEAEAVSESRLSVISSGISPGRDTDRSHTRTAVIADNAFAGARGLVQVNQSAGSSNTTTNHFALIVQPGAK